MGRRKPRWDWERGLSLPLVPYTPEEIKEILVEAGKEFSLKIIQDAIRELGDPARKAEEHRTSIGCFVYRLGWAASGYIIHRHDIDEAPRLSEVWAARDEIQTRAGVLLNILDSCQDMVGTKVRTAVEELQGKTGDLLDALFHMDGKTESICQLVLTKMALEPDQGGIPSTPKKKNKRSPQQEKHTVAFIEANDFLMDLKARIVAFRQDLKNILLPEPRRGRPRKAALAKLQSLEEILGEDLSGDLVALQNRLRIFLRAVEQIWLPEPGRGRPRRGGLQQFISELGEVYLDITGKKPGAPSDPLNGDYGPFVSFVEVCLKPLGRFLSPLGSKDGDQPFDISIKSSTLAKLIQETFRKADTSLQEATLPRK